MVYKADNNIYKIIGGYMQQYFGIKKENNLIYFNSDDINHIKNVMRMKENDELLMVYDNKRYLCSLNKDYLNGTVIKELESIKSEYEIVFYIPVVTEDKMDFVLKKGTELGVTKFIPVEYDHCKFKIKKEQKEKKLTRWNKIIKSASEQSHRITIPELGDIISSKNIKKNNGVNIVCSLDKVNVKPIKYVLNEHNIYDTIYVLYGPEGGLSKEEEKYFESIGYIKTSLGDTVLRTETVIVYVMSIILYLKSGV